MQLKMKNQKFSVWPKAAIAWTSFTACLLQRKIQHSISVDGQSCSWWNTMLLWNYLSISLCNCLILRLTAYKHPSILFRTLNTTLKLPEPIFWELRMPLSVNKTINHIGLLQHGVIYIHSIPLFRGNQFGSVKDHYHQLKEKTLYTLQKKLISSVCAFIIKTQILIIFITLRLKRHIIVTY